MNPPIIGESRFSMAVFFGSKATLKIPPFDDSSICYILYIKELDVCVFV